MNSSAHSSSDLMVVRNQDDFSRLCDLLLCNDPTVTQVCSQQIWCGRDSYLYIQGTQRFSLALQDNTMVRSMDINPRCWHVYDATAETGYSVDHQALQALLCFVQSNKSLSTVRIHDQHFGSGDGLLFVQPLLNAVVKNPSIQSFVARFPIPLNVLTQFVSAKHQSLRRLAVVIDDENDSQIIQAAARSIALHPALEDISLATQHGNTSLLPFLQSLHLASSSHPTLRRLEVAWSVTTNITADALALKGVLETSQNLCEVSLASMDVDGNTWTLISDGLRANSNVTRLALTICTFNDDAATLLLTNEPLNALQQHIQTLHLSSCHFPLRRDRLAIATDLARVLRGSQVRHVALDDSILRPECQTAFFDNLSSSDNDGKCTPLLHTIELSRMEPPVFESIAVYLPKTVRLRRLKIGILLRSEEDDTMAVVPNVFLSSLRRNGSLRSVRIKFDQYGSATASPSKRVRRHIRACTRRNRALPKAIPALFEIKHAHHVATGSSTSNITSPKTMRLPTLCTSAMQAPQMAPHNVLIGLLAASQQVAGQEGRDGKRVNGG